MAKSKKKKEKTVEPSGKAEPEAQPPEVEDDAAQEGATAAAASEQAAASSEGDRERYVRLQADFENYKKRTIRERNETYRRANEDIMEELLPVMDHLELALDAAVQHDADGAMVEGFRLVAEQLRTALAKFGLTPIDATDAEFDHHLHEAISHLPSADVAENHVIAMTRRGYKLGDKLLRAAQVVVSSGAPPEPDAHASAEEEPAKEPEA